MVAFVHCGMDSSTETTDPESAVPLVVVSVAPNLVRAAVANGDSVARHPNP